MWTTRAGNPTKAVFDRVVRCASRLLELSQARFSGSLADAMMGDADKFWLQFCSATIRNSTISTLPGAEGILESALALMPASFLIPALTCRACKLAPTTTTTQSNDLHALQGYQQLIVHLARHRYEPAVREYLVCKLHSRRNLRSRLVIVLDLAPRSGHGCVGTECQ